MRADPSTAWTVAQVRAAEAPLLAAGEPLMARAAAGLARAVTGVLEQRGRRTGRLLVLAGSGSNGGDALHAAALLLARGCTVDVGLLGRRVHPEGLRAATRAGARVLAPDTAPGALAALAADADVVLDGVLGTGAAASPALRPPARQAVAAVAAAVRNGPAVVAVDLPSGVGADDGSVHPPLLRASTTVVFGGMKAGLLRSPARGWCGRTVLVDIGLGPRPALPSPPA